MSFSSEPSSNARHVGDAHDRTVGVHAQRHRRELLGGLEQRLHQDRGVEPLPGNGRGAAELPGGDLHVVGANTGHHVGDGHAVLGQLVGVEPDPHGVTAAEGLSLAHTGHAREHVLDVGYEVVAQVDVGPCRIRGGQPDDHEEVARRLAHAETGLLHDFGQAGNGHLQLVLNLRPGQVRIGAGLEGQRQRRGARRVAGRLHVEQVIEAGHLLFDDLDHAVFDGLRQAPG